MKRSEITNNIEDVQFNEGSGSVITNLIWALAKQGKSAASIKSAVTAAHKLTPKQAQALSKQVDYAISKNPIGSKITAATPNLTATKIAGATAVGAAAIGGGMIANRQKTPDTGSSASAAPATATQSGQQQQSGGLSDREEMELNALAFDLEKMAQNNPEQSAAIQKMLEPYYAIYGK